MNIDQCQLKTVHYIILTPLKINYCKNKMVFFNLLKKTNTSIRIKTHIKKETLLKNNILIVVIQNYKNYLQLYPFLKHFLLNKKHP